jgi:O-antigen ligase
VGIGFKKQQEFMDKKVGIFVGSHNFYMDMLIQQGIIGFLLLLWFLYMLYKIIKNSVKNNSRKLAFTLFYMYLTMSFFQGGYYFGLNLLLQSVLLQFLKMKSCL